MGFRVSGLGFRELSDYFFWGVWSFGFLQSLCLRPLFWSLENLLPQVATGLQQAHGQLSSSILVQNMGNYLSTWRLILKRKFEAPSFNSRHSCLGHLMVLLR